jgi:2-dehydro-3-deoxygluconokinase
VTEVVTFGETMAALRGAGPLRLGGTLDLSIAGSDSNVAIGLARLGHSVQWIGRVGDDELGALVLRTLRAEGVGIEAVIVDPDRLTGLLILEQRIGDTVRVAYYRTGSAGGALRAADVLPALEQGARALHVTGVTPALGPDAAQAVEAALQRARELGIHTSLDVNYRSRLWTPSEARTALRPLVTCLDILFASDDELPLVATDVDADPATTAQALVRDDGVGTVVVKHGAAGATAYARDSVTAAPARKVRPVNVVGAGDAFVAGYLSANLDGTDVKTCLERGVVLGAFAVTQQGDWEGLPTREELHLLDLDNGETIR